MSEGSRHWRSLAGAVAVTLLSMAVVACGGSSSGSNKSKAAASIGKGEGQLNVIAWEGYTQPQWVKPFEQQTG